jgi:hypothetical protein
VLSYGSQWYVTRAAGPQDEHGTPWRQTAGRAHGEADSKADRARAAKCGTAETHSCWSARTESLSYWAETGEVWTQSGRVLFALPLASIDRTSR